MSNIIIPSENRDYCKDCADFCPLKDGTLTGDIKYCDHSLSCRQTDAYGMGYVSDWYEFRDEDTGESCFDYFCAGMHPRKDTDDNIDKKVS